MGRELRAAVSAAEGDLRSAEAALADAIAEAEQLLEALEGRARARAATAAAATRGGAQ